MRFLATLGMTNKAAALEALMALMALRPLRMPLRMVRAFRAN